MWFSGEWQEIYAKMYQNGRKSMKTSELEDQYTIIFGLALWPQETRDSFFQKELVFTKSVRSKMSKNVKIGANLVRDGDDGLRFGLYG